MRLATFHRYVARRFLSSFLMLLFILSSVILLFEFVELVREADGKPNATLAIIAAMSVLKLPNTVEVLFHFTVLFSAMHTFWRLTRSQELIVARAVGLSAWQFLLPALVTAAAIGAFKIMVFNPVAASMYGQYEQMQDRYIDNRTDRLDISRGGMWLREATDDGVAVIHADRARGNEVALEPVIVFLFDRDERFQGRVDAESAVLRSGHWHMTNAWVGQTGADRVLLESYQLPTALTLDSIVDSFASPNTLSFWALPDFIETLEETGFSSVRHRLHYNAMLAQPLLLAAMVLFAAAFSLRQTRRGGTLVMILGGIVTGFMMFFVNDVVSAFGAAEIVPILLAAWSPALITAFIGLAAVLHLEDG